MSERKTTVEPILIFGAARTRARTRDTARRLALRPPPPLPSPPGGGALFEQKCGRVSSAIIIIIIIYYHRFRSRANLLVAGISRWSPILQFSVPSL